MRRIWWYWLIIFIILQKGLRGQENQFPVAVKPFKEAFSLGTNPAGAGETEQLLAALSMSKPLGIPGLSQAGLAVIYPLAGSGLTAGFRRTGMAGYSDMKISAGAGKKLGKISIGARLNYRVAVSAGYLPSSNINLETGAILWINDQCYVSLQVLDITGRSNRKNTLSPLSMSGALGWQFSEQAFGGISWTKETATGMSVQALVIYLPTENISLKAGFIAGKQLIYFSSRYTWGALKPEFQIDYHQQLGFTPSIRIYYEKE